MLAALEETGGDSKSRPVQEAARALQRYLQPEAARQTSLLTGRWSVITAPDFPGRLGTTAGGGAIFTLGRLAFAQLAVEALNEVRPGPKLNASLLNGVTTSNAGQTAKRPLGSGLTLDKAYSLIPGWRPRTTKEALQHWMNNPRGKELGK